MVFVRKAQVSSLKCSTKVGLHYIGDLPFIYLHIRVNS